MPTPKATPTRGGQRSGKSGKAPKSATLAQAEDTAAELRKIVGPGVVVPGDSAKAAKMMKQVREAAQAEPDEEDEGDDGKDEEEEEEDEEDAMEAFDEVEVAMGGVHAQFVPRPNEAWSNAPRLVIGNIPKMFREIEKAKALADQPPPVLGGVNGDGKKKTNSAKRPAEAKQRARDMAAARPAKISRNPTPFETLDMPALESDSDSEDEDSMGRDMENMSKPEQALASLHMQYYSIVEGMEDYVQRVFPPHTVGAQRALVSDRRRPLPHAA